MKQLKEIKSIVGKIKKEEDIRVLFEIFHKLNRPKTFLIALSINQKFTTLSNASSASL